jgi:hypothetical protein
MANAINQNLEMINVVQDSLDKRFTTIDNKHKHQGDIQDLEGIAQGQTLKSDLIVTGNKIFTDAACKTRKIPGTQGTLSTGIGIFCHLQRQNTEEKILIQASATSTAPSPLHAEALGLAN